MLLPLAVAIALSAQPAQPAQPAGALRETVVIRSVLVMDLSGSAVDPGTLRTITNTLAVSVAKRPHLAVLSGDDVRKMAEVEASKQVLGCDVSAQSCLAEIAGAMGADLVLYGDVGKLGELYVVNLNLFDAGQSKALGRQSVQTKAFDESFIAQLDIAVRTLLAPVTGEKSTVFRGADASVPSIDLEALKQSGLKAINIDAERALETALDAQESTTSSPAAKRDAWCALSQVQGANPYLETATKACQQWRAYVVANEDLEKSLTADYRTLVGFMSLKRKTKDDKLAAIDGFLKTYARLGEGKQEIKAALIAEQQLKDDEPVTLSLDEDNDGILADKCPAQAEDKDGDTDDDGCPEQGIGEQVSSAGSGMADVLGDFIDVIALDFDKAPYLGMSLGFSGYLDPAPFSHTSLLVGGRLAWGPFEAGGGMNLDFSYLDSNSGGPMLEVYGGLQLFEIPGGTFGLLRPSAGVIVTTDLDDNGGFLIGPYVANTVRIWFFQIRPYYRFNVFQNDKNLVFPLHQVGVEGSFDMIGLFSLE